MNNLLVSLSDDPRATLAAGFLDAEQAIMNLKLVAALPKPPGFFDPDNPAGLPPHRMKRMGLAGCREPEAAEHGKRRPSGEDRGHGKGRRKMVRGAGKMEVGTRRGRR